MHLATIFESDLGPNLFVAEGKQPPANFQEFASTIKAQEDTFTAQDGTDINETFLLASKLKTKAENAERMETMMDEYQAKVKRQKRLTL